MVSQYNLNTIGQCSKEISSNDFKILKEKDQQDWNKKIIAILLFLQRDIRSNDQSHYVLMRVNVRLMRS